MSQVTADELIAKAERALENVQALLRQPVAQVKAPPKIRLNVDVYPYSFL